MSKRVVTATRKPCPRCSSTEHTGRLGCPNDPRLIADSAERIEATKRAKAEFAAWKAWNESGRKGPEPETSTLDVIRHTPRTPKKETKTMTKATVRFYRNGEPKADRYNTFGRVGRRDGYNAEQMTALLAKHGIHEPLTTTWVFTMPESGIVVGAVAEGDKVPAELLVRNEGRSTTKGSTKASTRTYTDDELRAMTPDEIEQLPKGAKGRAVALRSQARRHARAAKKRIEIEQHGKQSFAVVVDGEQYGKRLPSRKQAEALVAELKAA